MPTDRTPTPASPPPDSLLDEHDATVLRLLADLWRQVDPLPPALVPDVVFAVALDEVYAEVAEIQVSSETLAGVRGEVDVAAERTIVFTAEDMVLTILVTDIDGSARRVDGWLEARGDHEVLLRRLGETHRVAASDGRFCFHRVPAGSVQLLVVPTRRERHDPAVPPAARLVTPPLEL